MYNHNKAQQSKNRVHISWDILYENIAFDDLCGRAIFYFYLYVCISFIGIYFQVFALTK